MINLFFFFFSSRRRHTRSLRDWSSDVCSSDLLRGDGQNVREYLIVTAARLIDERGSAGLSVRDIAREARVADGVLYNYFEDKEDLLAHALLAHVGTVMNAAPGLPPAGTGT